MSYRKSWIILTIVSLSLAMFIPIARAQQQNFELRACSSTTLNVVHAASDFGISVWDQKGIIQSTHENKLFDNWTQNCVYVMKGVPGDFNWKGVCKDMGQDSEFIVWEFTGDAKSGSTGKAIYGSGKWKGIKGERKAQAITTGKPIAPNTFQGCNKIVGWIELQK
jgi:hypothetical protein